MEVILKEDIQKLGRAGDTVKVADGYGRNFLLPKQLAVVVTSANIKRLDQELKSKKGQAKRLEQDSTYLAEMIQEKPVVIKMASGEGGKLFGSVTSADIEKALAERGITVDKRKIELEEPIKLLGQFEVSVKVHPEVTARVIVSVEDENEKDEPKSVEAEKPPVEVTTSVEQPAAEATNEIQPAETKTSGAQSAEEQSST